MERWRWMPEDFGASYVVVNIAAFRLDVIERERSVLSMKTIVGKAYTRTPFFVARIESVIVNPWWNVPDSIASRSTAMERGLDREHDRGEGAIDSARYSAACVHPLLDGVGWR